MISQVMMLKRVRKEIVGLSLSASGSSMELRETKVIRRSRMRIVKVRKRVRLIKKFIKQMR